MFNQVDKKIIHPYSDQLAINPNVIPCYMIDEMLAEKLRALIQRSYTAPRDYYDIWYLSNNIRDLDWPKIVEAFHEKMKFKGYEFTGVQQLINADNDKKLKAAWKNSLGHQIAEETLPTYEAVREKLKALFEDHLIVKK